MPALNEAEERFAAYLDEFDYTWSHEPDYQAEFLLPGPQLTRPDFLVERDGMRVVAEVRQFETTAVTDRLARSGGYASLSEKEVYGALRFGLVEKAEQLRPLANAGVPLVIVLANPLGADVMLDAHHMQAAMWGNPRWVIPIDTATGAAPKGTEPTWQLEDYGVFASPVFVDGKIADWENRNPHISSILVVHEREHSMDWRDEILRRHPATDNSFGAAAAATLGALREVEEAMARGEEPEGSYRWVTRYDVNGDKAIELPPDWFAGPRDELYGYVDGGYGRIWTDR
jgi:hypothetical protein